MSIVVAEARHSRTSGCSAGRAGPGWPSAVTASTYHLADRLLPLPAKDGPPFQVDPHVVPSAGADENAQRARHAYDALCHRLYDRPTRGFRRAPGRKGNSPEGLWPYANAWAATCAITEVDEGWEGDLEDRLAGLLAYHSDPEAALGSSGPLSFEPHVTPPFGLGGDPFYDDNGWVALALLHHARITGGSTLYELAERVFGFVASGWSQDPELSHPGGVRWAVPASKVTRNACSTAPAIEVAALLFQHSRDSLKLDWAVRAYRWMRDTLRGPDELYADRIEPDGIVHRQKWSYNQGAMIGAGALLHAATGEQQYLKDAQRTASASLGWLGSSGVVDTQRPPLFSIYLRNLLLLPGLTPSSDEIGVARSYAESWWNGPARRSDGLFQRGDDLVNPTAGMVMIYSLLAGSPPHA